MSKLDKLNETIKSVKEDANNEMYKIASQGDKIIKDIAAKLSKLPFTDSKVTKIARIMMRISLQSDQLAYHIVKKDATDKMVSSFKKEFDDIENDVKKV